MRRKRIAVLTSTLLVIIGMVFSLCSCFLQSAYEKYKKENLFETEFFLCRYTEEHAEVTIYAFTELGEKQEILVIPQAINGKPVTRIGGNRGFGIGPEPYLMLKNSNLKKLYINADISHLNDDNKHEILNADIIVNSKIYESDIIHQFHAENTFYVKNESSFQNSSLLKNDYLSSIHNANIRYFIDSATIYMIDNYSKYNYYAYPEAPSKEGYTFEGWYTDEDFNNKWDKSFPKSQEEELNLYAKWIKI